MGVTHLKIHPAIGIARLGNSPDEFFVGPETADEAVVPEGGYKDAQFRVKRQAARFRVFAYHDDGTPPTEVTEADGDIVWRVRLANKKAAQWNSDVTGPARDGLVIAPSEKSVSGANASARLDDGFIAFPGHAPVNVPLGEIRTDSAGRLLVLGASGNSGSPAGAPASSFDGWYDDIADGFVGAVVTYQGKSYGATPSWVIISPPKFAPPVGPPITLYDRLYDYYASNGMFGLSVPNPIFFRRHIYPILASARAHAGVHAPAQHAHSTMAESLYPLGAARRAAVVAKLWQEGGNMPQWNGAELTNVQYQMMLRWRDADSSFVDDWTTPPAPLPLTPEELDRGPLAHSVGASFHPGIEAGNYLLEDTSRWMQPFRLDPALVAPGDVTSTMWLPWQADFSYCGDKWWPSHRPNQVVRQGTDTYIDWASSVPNDDAMVTKWHTLGFVVRDGDKLVEVERSETPYIALENSALNLVDVAQGPGGVPTSRAAAIVLNVSSSTPETFQIVVGANTGGFSRITTGPVVVESTGARIEQAKLWVGYTTGAVGSSSTGTATVRHLESGQEWVVSLAGNTVARQRTAVALVLDHSSGMNDPRGDSGTKIDALKEAAAVFVDLALQDDGIAGVSFNQDVTGELPVTVLGPHGNPPDPGRKAVKRFVDALTPSGASSIGDGLAKGNELLDAAGQPRTALVLVTDGKENRPLWIDDVAGRITATTYAVGIGRADNFDVDKLQALTSNREGYLLATGPITSDNRFLLTKYFLQVLAELSNAETVHDSDGILGRNQVQRIPFQLTDADQLFDAVLLSPDDRRIDFRLVSPLGHRITPGVAEARSDVDHVASRRAHYYRVRLPVALLPQRPSHAGQWHVELRWPRADERQDGATTTSATIPYGVQVYTWTDLALRAWLDQIGTSPGAEVSVHATLSYFGAPYEGEAGVWAEVTHPNGGQERVVLRRGYGGVFSGQFVARGTGVHRVRVKAQGRTQRGWTFEREQALTALTVRGAGEGFAEAERRRSDRELRDLVEYLLDGQVPQLAEMRRDPERIKQLLSRYVDEKHRDELAG